MKRNIRLFASLILLLSLSLSLFSCGEMGDYIKDEVSGYLNEELSGLIDFDLSEYLEEELSQFGEVVSDESVLGSISVADSVETGLLDRNGSYTTKAAVSFYLDTYGTLPVNFITKDEARELGWEGGGLEDYAPGKCIGGDVFGNYEGLLPAKEGRVYYECDIDTLGASSRGAKRIVYSNDGLIYYTEDHYDSFELLYGEE